jgi:26S proteasome regulatory subunit N2
VILLIDTQPQEEKVLIEEKLKKAPTAKAAAPTTLEDMRNESFNLRRQADAQGEASGSGAAAAAGVLTAFDEDDEGGEEAEVPREFEYFSDNEDESS